MKQVQKIGAGQIMAVFICSRIVAALTYSFDISGNSTSNAEWFAALLLIPILLIMAIPAFCLYRQTGLSAVNSAYAISKPVGVITSILFALFFLAGTITSVSRFNIFLTSSMETEHASFFYPVIILIPACYAAIKGIEALSRASCLIAISGLLSIFIIIAAVLNRFDFTHILSPLYYGADKLVDPIIRFISNTTEIVSLLILFPRITGNTKKAYVGFSVISGILISVILFTTIAVFGTFASYQNFPFYSVAGIAEIGELKQLSALHAATWMLGLFVKCSLFLYLTYTCLEDIIPEKYRKTTILLCSTVIFILTSLMSSDFLMSIKAFSAHVWIYTIAFFSIVIPLLLIIGNAIKEKSLRNRRSKAPTIS